MLRQTLEPQIDPYGRPVPEPDRFGPITNATPKQDKVLTEAARLGVGVAKAPKSVSLPAAGLKEAGKVELTPEQRTVFATEGGMLAYDNLKMLVNVPGWDTIADPWQKQAMEEVFQFSKIQGDFHALPMEQREKEMKRILADIQTKMKAEHKR